MIVDWDERKWQLVGRHRMERSSRGEIRGTECPSLPPGNGAEGWAGSHCV